MSVHVADAELNRERILIRERCTVCSGGNVSLFLQESTADVCKCRDCGHVFTRTIYHHQQSWKEQLVASAGWNVEGEKNPRDPFYTWALDHLDSIAPAAGRRLFEVGCATGRFLDLASQRGYVATGVEPSADASIARQRAVKANVVRGAFPEQFPDTAPFDVIASFEVLEHIPNVEVAVARISELLLPGGHFIGTVPNRLFHEKKVWPRRNLKISWLGVPLTLGPDHHLNYFSPSGLAQMFSRYGLTMQKVTTPPQTDFGLQNGLSKYLRRAYGTVMSPIEWATHTPVRTNFFWDAVKR
jgi:2-polyprenyl-3-methyl-5-hydroxy-6-metoxy-1,4-benzoquinol methylase